ncbi:MAG: GntR family transcriptional regulator, partial [Clostridia bacterium]|nr:GntR family transcriptional regulator [Clostridia bacterium]
MKYSFDADDKSPLYLQLYYQIREDIVSGTIAPGTKLPSKRIVAEECGVSVITVEHTYSLLCDEGYAYSKERSGYFAAGDSVIPSRAESSRQIKHASPEGHIKTEFPLSAFKRHMRYVIAEYDDELVGRSPNNGMLELREAISGYLERFRGVSVTPAQIVIGSGSEYLYSLLIQLFGRDLLFAIEDPCYKKIEQVYNANGVKFEKLPLAGDGIESKSLKKCRAKVLHVTPYHSFPSGVTASPAKRAEYVAWAKANGAYVVEDDYESENSRVKLTNVKYCVKRGLVKEGEDPQKVAADQLVKD